MAVLKSVEELVAVVENARSQGKKIVTTNGCFDILHVGHVRYLNDAKSMGDVLIVGLNSDESVKRLKGEERPLNAELNRAEVLSNLKSVDFVYIFREDTPVKFLEYIMPDIHVKGGDYTDKGLPERDVVEKNGGRMVFSPFVFGFSTTEILNKVKNEG